MMEHSFPSLKAMAHRVRSRTADSAEAKKTKGTPRRLTEKIAIMKRREHEQSEAFEKAMKSIFEMQQARTRIHSGGGSMPSLQAIDSGQIPPSIDMQSVFNDLNEVTQRTSRERPHSGGPSGRRMPFDRRTQSCDTDPYPTAIGMGHADHYLKQPTEWMEGDLSRHKSDSDLQQSLLAQQMQQFPPLLHPQLSSPQPVPRNHKLAAPNDLGMWGKQKRPASISAATALLSPDTPLSNTLAAPGVGTASSSLPDLTNIEFQSGLEVPLECDDPIPDQQPMFPYHSSPAKGPMSNLLYNSFQANQQHPNPPNSFITNHAYVQQPLRPNVFRPHLPLRPLPSHPPPHPPYSHPQGVNIPALNLNPSANWRPSLFNNPPHPGAIRKSPTTPDFQNSTSGANTNLRMTAPSSHCTTQQHIHPLLPSLVNPAQNRMNPYHHMGIGGAVAGNLAPNLQPRPSNNSMPMTIIIQPPVSSSVSTTSTLTSNFSPQPVPELSPPPPLATPSQLPSSQPQVHMQPSSTPSPLPLSNSATEQSLSIVTNPPKGAFPTTGANSSLPATPTITISPGMPALPSYLEAKQQQALQERFASFNMHKTEHLVRSHSEENLQQKGQKEKSDLMHNPFMGNLANASSVPCVYVDSPSTENLAEQCDSPTPGDSPSTSASYASSPPSVRPYWIDQHQPNEFVFHGHEWPMMDGMDRNKPGSPSPISHHKSLSDLNAAPECVESSPKNRSLQLSLPSVVMSDLAMDDQVEKPGSPTFQEYDVEEAVMDTLLKQEDLPSLQNFDVGLLVSDALMSSSPDSLLHRHLHF